MMDVIMRPSDRCVIFVCLVYMDDVVFPSSYLSAIDFLNLVIAVKLIVYIVCIGINV